MTSPKPITLEQQIEALDTEIRVLTACDLIDPKYETPHIKAIRAAAATLRGLRQSQAQKTATLTVFYDPFITKTASNQNERS